jgi:hypothetical protein
MVSDLVKSNWLRIIRAEYMELPGLVLTEPQVRRLWGLDPVTCDLLLDELVQSGFLKRTAAHGYARASNCY